MQKKLNDYAKSETLNGRCVSFILRNEASVCFVYGNAWQILGVFDTEAQASKAKDKALKFASKFIN